VLIVAVTLANPKSNEIDEVDGRTFIAMELLEGQTLRHRIAGKPLEIEAVLDLGHPDRRCPRCSTFEGHHPSGHQASEHRRYKSRSGKDSWIVQMFGWFSEDAALASRWKRLRACGSLASHQEGTSGAT
jgi:hypothetical protein